MCADSGTIFSFTRITDNLARGQVTSTDPDLAIFAKPVPPDAFAEDEQPVYAPVAISGLTIAVNIESQAAFNATDPEVIRREGRRITDVKLNARLVAKLLTHSYRRAVGLGQADHVAGNPSDLTQDKEFLDLNPVSFKQQFFPNVVATAVVSLQSADATEALWAWIDSDPDARSFLDGVADPNGMKVNPFYKGDALSLPTDFFPKQDPFCYLDSRYPTLPERCALDTSPYAADLGEAGRAASRGRRSPRHSEARSPCRPPGDASHRNSTVSVRWWPSSTRRLRLDSGWPPRNCGTQKVSSSPRRTRHCWQLPAQCRRATPMAYSSRVRRLTRQAHTP